MNRTPPGTGAVIATEAISEGEISARVAELGEVIAHDYRRLRPVLVCVLYGAFVFHADLVRAIPIRCETDFLGLTRFGHGGKVRLALDTSTNLAGRHVLVVEDIVDTGLTHLSLYRTLEARNCKSLRTVTLLDRTSRRIVDLPIGYRGFEVGDEFLVGYGLDWRGKFRSLRSLWAILDIAGLAQDPDALLAIAHPMSADSLKS